MPFKSWAQVRKFGSLVSQGKMKENVFKKWLKHTPDMNSLPEKKGMGGKKGGTKKISKKSPKKKVSMTRGSFVKEHKHLVKVLKTGSKSAQKKEAKDQAKELKHLK
jgi:hypothetical protein